MPERSATLFEGRDSGGVRSLTATVNEDGSLNLVQLHGGPAVTEVMGASVGWSEFNVSVKAEAVPGLVAMLGGTPDDDVLGVLEARWRDGDLRRGQGRAPHGRDGRGGCRVCGTHAWLN